MAIDLNLMAVLIAFAVILIGLILGIKVYEFLRKEKQGYPYEDEIEDMILPLIYQAIFVGFKTSEEMLDRFGETLCGADKKRIAVLIYNLIPDVILVRGIPIEVKKLISEEQFSIFIQKVYDEMIAFFMDYKETFVDMAEQWLQENKACD